MSQSKSTLSQTVYSVLPDNHSHLERALELSFSSALYSVDHLYPELLDATKIPVEFLPYLATERQVLDWSNEDLEIEKRLTTSNQWNVFKLSGTRAGIKKALAGFGGETEIINWYDSGGDPYHMNIRVWISKAPTEQMLTRVSNRIAETKSERDTFKLGVGLKAVGKLFVGGVVQLAPSLIIGPWIPPLIKSYGNIYNGGVIVSAFKVIAK